jgi:hypothetical protein
LEERRVRSEESGFRIQWLDSRIAELALVMMGTL